ncbi:transglycosylase domain-containing protein [Bacillus sp. SL00103]
MLIDEKKLVFHASSQIIDQNGKELKACIQKNRDPVSIKDVPDKVAKPLWLSRTSVFMSIMELMRSQFQERLSRHISRWERESGVQLLSTAKYFSTNDKTFHENKKEVIIAINLERDYSKDKPLEMFESALLRSWRLRYSGSTNYYFSKDVKDLTVSEGATLAAIKAPSTYSPVLHPG